MLIPNQLGVEISLKWPCIEYFYGFLDNLPLVQAVYEAILM